MCHKSLKNEQEDRSVLLISTNMVNQSVGKEAELPHAAQVSPTASSRQKDGRHNDNSCEVTDQSSPSTSPYANKQLKYNASVLVAQGT